jgi:hypothetical protein
MSDGRTVMEVAAAPSRLAACSEACAKRRTCFATDEGLLVLAWAASRRGAHTLLNRRNLRGDVPLHRAAATGDIARINLLLQQPGIEVDVRNNYERIPLLEACYWDHTDVAIELVRARADVNAFSPSVHDHGDSPLICAVRNKNEHLVEVLCLEPGLDKNQNSMVACPFGTQAIGFARSDSMRSLLSSDLNHTPDVPLEELYGLDMMQDDVICYEKTIPLDFSVTVKTYDRYISSFPFRQIFPQDLTRALACFVGILGI